MDRIAIIGCGGSGKTHLANNLAALLNVPLTHLDGLYYDADWNPLPQEELAAIQRDLVSAPRWLIEGNYAGTLPIRLAAADTVIFLDLPAITWNFIRYICGYRKTMRPRIRRLLSQNGSTIQLITLTTHRQADRFAAHLEAEPATRT